MRYHVQICGIGQIAVRAGGRIIRCVHGFTA
jgi:hypothetical protein